MVETSNSKSTYKVLLADDEYLVRERLKKIIKWEELGFFCIGEAEDGEHALRLTTELLPDLIIVDINMPFMNGLKLIKAVKELPLKPEIIILSGYDDFSYAQEAIRSNVREYLVKPVNAAELHTALLHIREILDAAESRKQIQTEQRKDQQALQENLEAIFMHKLLTGEWKVPSGAAGSSVVAAQKEVPDFLQYLEKADYTGTLHLLALPIRFAEAHACQSAEQVFARHQHQAEALHLYAEKILNPLLSELRKRGLSVYRFPLLNGGDLIFIDSPTSGLPLISHYINLQVIKELKNLPIPCYVHLISGGICSSIDGIQEQYFSIRRALLDRFFFPQKLEYRISESKGESYQAAELARRWSQVLDHNSLDEVEAVVKEHRSAIATFSHGVSLEIYLGWTQTKIREYLQKMRLPAAELSGITMEPLKILSWFDDLDGFFDWIRELIRQVIRMNQGSVDQEVPCLSERVKQCIESEYADPSLDLQAIAQQVFAHPNYISARFKEEVGIGISAFLTSVRLSHAKELLEKTDMSIQEIAWSVGYTDQFYFSKCFKKMYDCTPRSLMDSRPLKGSFSN